MSIKQTIVGLCLVFAAVPSMAPAQPVCIPGSHQQLDYDLRGDVALPDHAVLAECLSGPGAAPTRDVPPLASECLGTFDTDTDGDVDLANVAAFMLSYTGECEGLGACPPGTHLEHRSGETGIVNQDSTEEAPPDAADYLCAADQTCDREECSGRGTCSVIDGQAVCACKPGYAGATCDTCAVGFERDSGNACVLGPECRERWCSGQGDCQARRDDIVCACDAGASGSRCENGGGDPNTLRAPTYIQIEGTALSVEPSEARLLCPTLFGGGQIDNQLVWTLNGPGELLPGPGLCRLYIAPPAGSFTDSQVVEIEVCAGRFPDECATRYLTVDPPGGIKSTGQFHLLFKPFDDAIKKFMWYRCIGGAVLGVSVFGKPVYVRGYGNISGAPTNNESYLDACGDTFDVSHEIPGYTLPNPSEVQPNTPFRIGSITKCVTAAILRKVIKEEILTTDTDENVEATRLCDGILPVPLHEVACLGDPPPVPLLSATGLPPDCDNSNPCPYGGNCVVTNEATGTGYCDNCPTGFGGQDCSQNLTYCPSMASHADDRWEDVTLGHVMGHRAGLPRSVPDTNSVFLPNVFRLRSLMVESDWQDQEDLLTSQSGFPNGTFNNEFPDYSDAKDAIGNSAYFIPRPGGEAILVRMGACLLYTPGTTPSFDTYSNTDYSLLGEVIEAVTGRNYGARTGKPEMHNGSLLEEFADEELGLPIPGQGTAEGIYASQDNFKYRHPKEPIWRSWSTSGGGTYYALVSDTKRPYCDWIANECNFNAWINGTDRFDWFFEDKSVINGYQGGGTDAAQSTGSISTEAEVFLRFMAKYWVGGDGANPRYGETRCPGGDCVWTKFTGHNGKRAGTYAEAKQLGGPVKTNNSCDEDSDCASYTACSGTGDDHTAQQFCLVGSSGSGYCYKRNQLTVPRLDAQNNITDDFADLECTSCRLPLGVDIFIAINQDQDKKCVEAQALDKDDPDYYSCSDAYAALPSVVLHAACKISWPANPFVLWPPVVATGGSSMSPGLSGGP